MTRLLQKILALFIFSYAITVFALNNNSRVAFYYGANPPLNELHAFSVVVVQPAHNLDVKKFNSSESELYAYVSIGEVENNASYKTAINPDWLLGINKTWNSQIADLGNPEWRKYLLEKQITPLWQQGYRGFFLDTLDSYHLLHLQDAGNQRQIEGINAFIRSIKTKYPNAKIITNRGFEVLDKVAPVIDAVAAESLFWGWDNARKIYQPITENDRAWLLKQLEKTQKVFHLPVIILDYVPDNNIFLAREVAKKIANLGFIPWVSNPALDKIGIGAVEVFPRQILILYDNNVTEEGSSLPTISAFYYLSFPLNFLGYVPILKKVDKDLLAPIDMSKFAGIVTWFSKPVIKNSAILEEFLTAQVDKKIPVLFMQYIGLPDKSALIKKLGLKFENVKGTLTDIKAQYFTKKIDLTFLPNIISNAFTPLSCTNCQKQVLLTGSNQQTEVAVAFTNWGGYVLSPYHIAVLPNYESRWIIEPFDFIHRALRLPTFPIGDVTTDVGRRILTVHIDGDAFISRVPWRTNKYAGEIIYEDILLRYQIPTSVSIIQREFELLSPRPDLQQRLLKAARETFALPWVEIASHTYSHPLLWQPLVEGKDNGHLVAYPDKTYLFNYEQEITGTINYINKYLAPNDKKASIIFWPGDGDIHDKPLAIAVQAGLKNINGFAGIYTNYSHSLTNLAGFGIYRGNNFQVFAPVANDFQYTDNWAKPLYAFEKVIDTYKLSESPVRFKPLSIYYHFYSATDQAALRALKRIYNWALKQNTIALFISDYIDKVISFNETAIARYPNDRWLITNNKQLREFRWPKGSGYPDLQLSKNVIGFAEINDYLYIHLGPKSSTQLVFSSEAPVLPYLVEANAQVVQWDKNDRNLEFTLLGNSILKFKFANIEHCGVRYRGQTVQIDKQGYFFLAGIKHATFTLQC